jgi:hypothetical protein
VCLDLEGNGVPVCGDDGLLPAALIERTEGT